MNRRPTHEIFLAAVPKERCKVSEYFGDSTELVYLRARNYTPSIGRFLTRDTWDGLVSRPLSFNKWNYVDGNPINLTDPSGKTPVNGDNYPRHCQTMTSKAAYGACVLQFFHLQPFDPNNLGQFVEGSTGCYTGPTRYRAPGYIEGLSVSAYDFTIAHTWGWEMVYDFATMQRDMFSYEGWGLQAGTVLAILRISVP